MKAPSVQINGQQIEMVKCFNFLGITIDDCLNWTFQIDIVCKKVSQTIGILKNLKLYFPIHILKNMYYSLILSYLNYGILAWGYKSEKIVKIQKSRKDCGQFTI